MNGKVSFNFREDIRGNRSQLIIMLAVRETVDKSLG